MRIKAMSHQTMSIEEKKVLLSLELRRLCLPLLVLLCLCYGPIPLQAQARQTQRWYTNIQKARLSARKQSRPLLLDFYVPWCAYCAKLQKEVYPSDIVRQATSKFIKLRINGENNPQALGPYQISAFPAIIFLDSNGVYLDRLDGFVNAERLARKVRDVYRRAHKHAGILQELKRHSGKAEAHYKAGIYYFKAGSYALAHKHFLRAWQLGEKKGKEQPKPALRARQKKSLYNASVSSMYQKDYKQAHQYWEIYLSRYKEQDQDYVHARYYRGISLYHLGQKTRAKEDLYYSIKRLHNRQERIMAQALIQSMDS